MFPLQGLEMIPLSKINSESVDTVMKYLQKDNNKKIAFQKTSKTMRKTYSLGYDYFALSDGIDTFTPIPDYLKMLCQECIHSFSKEYQLGKAEDYLNVIVSFYEPGYRLEPHVDVDFSDRITDGKHVNFYFGENVLGIILQADPTGKLYFLKSDEESLLDNQEKFLELNEFSGMTYLLNQHLRRKPFYHGVSQVTEHRLSVTFRTVKFLMQESKDNIP